MEKRYTLSTYGINRFCIHDNQFRQSFGFYVAYIVFVMITTDIEEAQDFCESMNDKAPG